jgi:nucleoside-diphosphate-sugar epimerase
MKVLITGVGGNLGRVLAPALADQGHEYTYWSLQ